MADVAAESGVPVETLRKIETGRIATPAFFTVVALAAALGVDLERVAAQCFEAQCFEAQCAPADEAPPRAASA